MCEHGECSITAAAENLPDLVEGASPSPTIDEMGTYLAEKLDFDVHRMTVREMLEETQPTLRKGEVICPDYTSQLRAGQRTRARA